MQCVWGVWVVTFIGWRCICLDFSSFLAVKMRRAAVRGQNEFHVNVFAEFSYEEVHPCIALIDK